MLFGRAVEKTEESRWAKSESSPWTTQAEQPVSRWSKPSEPNQASPWTKQAAPQAPAPPRIEECENVGDEIWDALSLLAQQRVEAPAEADPETPVNLVADERTGTLVEAAHKHPLVARMMAAGPSAPEVPFDERKNVILLREAYQGMLDGTLTKAEYRGKMEQLLQLSTVAVAICKNPRLKREKDKLPADELAVIDRMRSACDKLKAGIDKMWRVVNNGSRSELEQGYREASNGMWDLYLTQQEAYRKEQEIDRKVEEGTYNSQWTRSDGFAGISKD